MNFLRFTVSVIVTCVLVSASAQERKITIGAMYNLTGGQGDLDRPSAQGARLAVAEANADGGVLGRPLTLRLVDGQTDSTVIAAQANRLFAEDPDIAGLIGFSDTDMVLAAAPIVAEHRRVFVTSGATSPLLPQQVPDYLFLACFGDNVQAAAAAEWAYATLNTRTVVILFNGTSSYARLLHNYFAARFKELGGKVLAVVPYQPSSFAQATQKLPQADLIYLAAQPDDVGIAIPALRAAGVAAPILGGDGLDIGNAWRQVKDARNVYFTTHAYISADNPDPRVQVFHAAFAKAYPDRQPDAFAALGYDTARLLMAAIKTAGSAEPSAVREALARTSGFEGVTGTISYRAGSHIPSKPVAIIAIEEGRQSYKGSVTPRQVPPP